MGRTKLSTQADIDPSNAQTLKASNGPRWSASTKLCSLLFVLAVKVELRNRGRLFSS